MYLSLTLLLNMEETLVQQKIKEVYIYNFWFYSFIRYHHNCVNYDFHLQFVYDERNVSRRRLNFGSHQSNVCSDELFNVI